jgi:hypothetical protein
VEEGKKKLWKTWVYTLLLGLNMFWSSITSAGPSLFLKYACCSLSQEGNKPIVPFSSVISLYVVVCMIVAGWLQLNHMYFCVIQIRLASVLFHETKTYIYYSH